MKKVKETRNQQNIPVAVPKATKPEKKLPQKIMTCSVNRTVRQKRFKDENSKKPKQLIPNHSDLGD